jgi:hypothetical protein
MDQLRTLGLVLIVLGILSFGYQGFATYKTRDKVFDAGPIQVTAEKTHKVEVPQVAGAVALIGGTVLLLAGVKRA